MINLAGVSSPLSPAGIRTLVNAYVRTLARLHKSGFLGKLVIYPANGVDFFPALFTRMEGLNQYPYNPMDVPAEILPMLPPRLAAHLKTKLRENLTITSRIDVCRLDRMRGHLAVYEKVTPKSLVIKGLFDSAFKCEWDTDRERYYPVSPVAASENARAWLGGMLEWLNRGDFVVAFDRPFFPFLEEHHLLTEVQTGLRDHSTQPRLVCQQSVPLIYLPAYARVFEIK